MREACPPPNAADAVTLTTCTYPVQPAVQQQLIDLWRSEWTRTDYDWLEALSGDDFPRQLSWSEGLCGLTLLPSSLFDGRLPVAAWPENGGRPCLVPLANLWRQRVSSLPPQLD